MDLRKILTKANKDIDLDSSKAPSPSGDALTSLDEVTLTNILCDSLASDVFNVATAINILEHFKGKRIIYSIVSNRMFTLYDDKAQTSSNAGALFVSNVDKLKDDITCGNDNELKKIVMKLYDHTQLAIHQVNMFRLNKDQFENMVKNSDILNQKIESVNSQVLSLVALFTAMAFLVFGGLSSFESIFSNIQSVSLPKLIVLAAVWGLGITNIIAVFMFFTSRIIGKSFSVAKTDDTLFHKYPYLIASNYSLISIFLVFSWVYVFLNEFDLHADFLCKDYWTPIRIIIAISLSVVLFFLYLLYRKFFLKKNTPSED